MDKILKKISENCKFIRKNKITVSIRVCHYRNAYWLNMRQFLLEKGIKKGAQLALLWVYYHWCEIGPHALEGEVTASVSFLG